MNATKNIIRARRAGDAASANSNPAYARIPKQIGTSAWESTETAHMTKGQVRARFNGP
jgi:hypothetical protein